MSAETNLSVRSVPTKIVRELKKVAEAEDRSLNSQILVIFKAWYDSRRAGSQK
jgi:hypothetical protein